MAHTRTASSQQDLPGPEGQVNQDDILKILARHEDGRGGLIAILQDIQERCGYLPAKALKTVAERTGRSMVDIYGVATFYRSFSLQPRGRHTICVCLGTACHVRSAPRIVEQFERQLGVEAGQTTPDRQFTLETVNCLGACALGPIVVLDGRYYSKVDPAKVNRILKTAQAAAPQAEIPASAEANKCEGG